MASYSYVGTVSCSNIYLYIVTSLYSTFIRIRLCIYMANVSILFSNGLFVNCVYLIRDFDVIEWYPYVSSLVGRYVILRWTAGFEMAKYLPPWMSDVYCQDSWSLPNSREQSLRCWTYLLIPRVGTLFFFLFPGFPMKS